MGNPVTRPVLQPIYDQLLAKVKLPEAEAEAEAEFTRRFYDDMPVAKLIVMGLLSEQQLQQLISKCSPSLIHHCHMPGGRLC